MLHIYRYYLNTIFYLSAIHKSQSKASLMYHFIKEYIQHI